MSENLNTLIELVNKFLELDNPKNDKDHLIVNIIQYYDIIKNSNNNEEKQKADNAILSIGKKFPKLSKWCNDMVNNTIEKNNYSKYLIGFLTISQKVLNLEKLKKKHMDYLRGLLYYYKIIRQNGNQEELKIAEKELSSVVKKFPMLSEFYDKLVTDNQNEKKYEEVYKNFITYSYDFF